MLRPLAALGLVLGAASLFTSCGGVPADRGPFALGEGDEGLVVVACEDLELSEMLISQAVVVEGDRKYPETIAEWDPSQKLSTGDPLAYNAVSPGSGFGGVGSMGPDATYFVDSLGSDGNGVTATFYVPSGGLPPGMWLGSDQSINVAPCDYWRR